MKKFTKTLAVIMAAIMMFSLSACGAKKEESKSEGGKKYTVGICNYVDDASLNQIVDNIKSQLETIGAQKGCEFEILYDNCNADQNVLAQIIENFVSKGVDLMVAVATPVAMAMQTATEDNQIPVVFAAVSDPLATGIVDSLEKPGKNITGTSDYLDTDAILNLIFVHNHEAKKIGLLYDAGQDSSTTSIEQARKYLSDKGVTIIEKTGTTVDEVALAAQALIAEEVDAIFTPTDNTVMTAELSIYEELAKAGIPHYAGANSFALNGAFLGYGVDYENLGRVTGDMVAEILIDGKNPAELSVRTFDNGTATVNSEICSELGLDFRTVKKTIEPYCTKVEEIVTANDFN